MLEHFWASEALMAKYLLKNLLIRSKLTPLRNKDFLLFPSSCSFLIGLCSSFDSLQNNQILDLSVLVPRFFLLQKSSRSSLLVLFASLFNCSRQCIAKSFTQKLLLGAGFSYLVPERAFHNTYAIRGTCPQEGATHFSGHI